MVEMVWSGILDINMVENRMEVNGRDRYLHGKDIFPIWFSFSLSLFLSFFFSSFSFLFSFCLLLFFISYCFSFSSTFLSYFWIL